MAGSLQQFDVHSRASAGSPDALWRAVAQSCGGMLTDWGVGILRKGLDNHLGSVVAETGYLCKDHRNLYSHYYSKKFHPGSPECIRLHFFSRDAVTPTTFRSGPGTLQSDYLGFSVIRPVSGRCLGRSVFSAERVGLSHYNLAADFKVHLRGQVLTVRGFPYTSQDTDVTVCAHAALWATCRYLSERYPVYREVYPYDLVEWTAPHRGRRAPHRGMTYEDYSTILTSFGAHPEVLRIQEEEGKQSLEKFQDMCSYIESGFPVLASLKGHVIVAIGHTLDFSALHHPLYGTAAADPLGMVDCSAYWKQIIVVDDNAFPHAQLGFAEDPANYLRQFRPPVSDVTGIRTAVIPLPEKAFLPVRLARVKMRSVFERRRDLLNAARQGSTEPLVIRLFITNGSSWQRRKVDAWQKTGDPLLSLAADIRYPHFIWVLQAAPLTLYKDHKCTAEVVMDATAGQHDDALLFGRFGNLALAKGEDAATLERVHTEAPMNWPLYKHNLGS